METISVNSWYEAFKTKLAGYPAFLPDIIIGLPAGLILGFLLKSLGRFLVIGLLVTAAVLWIADYFNVITIHQGEIESLLGMQPFHSVSEFGSFASQFIKNHVAASISFFVGFLLGWRLGL